MAGNGADRERTVTSRILHFRRHEECVNRTPNCFHRDEIVLSGVSLSRKVRQVRTVSFATIKEEGGCVSKLEMICLPVLFPP